MVGAGMFANEIPYIVLFIHFLGALSIVLSRSEIVFVYNVECIQIYT